MTRSDITIAEAREAGLAVPSDRVPALVDELGLSATAAEIAFKRCRAFQFSDPASGKDPDSVAAAAVYMGVLLTDDDVTQEAIADAAGISVVPIRELYPVLFDAAWDDDLDPIRFKADIERALIGPEGAADDRRRPQPAPPMDDAARSRPPALPPDRTDADREEGSEP